MPSISEKSNFIRQDYLKLIQNNDVQVQINETMKAWSFKVKRNPIEINKKLESALGNVDGLVFKMNQDKNDSITFKARKRIVYAWYIIFFNYVVV